MAYLGLRIQSLGIDFPDVARLRSDKELILDLEDIRDVIVGQVRWDDLVDDSRKDVLVFVWIRSCTELGVNRFSMRHHLSVGVRFKKTR